MKKSKTKKMTILEFEGVVNRLLESHSASYSQWEKVRLKQPETKSRQSGTKQQLHETKLGLLNA
jgi:hypothetical protein